MSPATKIFGTLALLAWLTVGILVLGSHLWAGWWISESAGAVAKAAVMVGLFFTVFFLASLGRGE